LGSFQGLFTPYVVRAAGKCHQARHEIVCVSATMLAKLYRNGTVMVLTGVKPVMQTMLRLSNFIVSQFSFDRNVSSKKTS
jgi:hypothetical protein